MKTKENKGISLIVLVITIIVIIILAAAIIITLNNNNPIKEANEARIKSDVANMQAIFTNTVAKVMAKNQCTMEIKASALNTVTSGVSSSTGDANYTLNNPVNSESVNGRIIFDNDENTEAEYYTGKQLPIYSSGKTTWYVDEEGIISLQVGEKTYGDGKIVNGIKITATVIASEEYIKEKAKVRVEVNYEDELQNVVFNGDTITSFEKQDNVYVIEKEVSANGIYEIVANGQNGATSKVSVTVNEIENLNSNIQIKNTVTPTSDYVKATIGLEITFNGEVESIKINEESVTVPSKSGGKYVISKEVTENGEYKVEVKGKDGTTNKKVVSITDLTEDMEIWNRADMESFRDKVNSGRTFEGKTATVMADIDLGGSSNNWTPVANYGVNNNLIFKGTFEGNNKTISGLYINNSNNKQGLFGCNNGEIRNIKINGNITTSGSHVGAIAGINELNIINCHNSVAVQGSSEAIGGITGSNKKNIEKCSNNAKITGKTGVGGITGYNWANVKYCFNNGAITATWITAGGITGYHPTGNVYNCYNKGTIKGTELSAGGINGAAGLSGYQTAYTYNCYNIGSINAPGNAKQITGESNANNGISQEINCYSTNATVTGLNGGAYSDNVWKADKTPNINNGYPILNWQ